MIKSLLFLPGIAWGIFNKIEMPLKLENMNMMQMVKNMGYPIMEYEV